MGLFIFMTLNAAKVGLSKKVKALMTALCDVQWWIDNIRLSDNEIYQDPPSLTMTTDASTFGWGATLNSIRTGGELLYEESLEHINVLELIAVLFGLKSLIKQTNKQINM